MLLFFTREDLFSSLLNPHACTSKASPSWPCCSRAVPPRDECCKRLSLDSHPCFLSLIIYCFETGIFICSSYRRGVPHNRLAVSPLRLQYHSKPSRTNLLSADVSPFLSRCCPPRSSTLFFRERSGSHGGGKAAVEAQECHGEEQY